MFNSAFLAQPRSELVHYDKRLLLPFGEAQPLSLGESKGDLDAAVYSRGDRAGIMEWAGPTLGNLICFEAVYPELARELQRGGARLLVNIANDGWLQGRGGPEQHLAQAVFRSIETGLPMVRVCTTGFSASIGPDGEIAERLAPDQEGVLRVRVATGRQPAPLYARIGDAFAFGCAGLLGLAVAGPLPRRASRPLADRRPPLPQPR